ncbi:signal peptidase II [Enterococcus saccharolyticus subsp. saccharolyticus ATCC 43076]|uniref:Lipoprotein signal peptidase n=1 Tax=Enterococcus saccharolyticus subsp. saccharolyticus ATCC 43076 TaxID=1139996 RepID=S0NIP7_9ENTE|nr:signal peptidase II [Enterococcus saccharolyticus]EOT29326.1 signal peptidase II [Enterococcus saccharolyticus subsp. saccharolyticus ATCC 43076]EOT81124.1 signal peptidase II [Enterococcus saccharolyticus subsp. saccharolyticus ATCC 43076]
MIVFYFLFSALVIGLDQWVKFWIVSNFALGDTQNIIPNILSFTYVQNTGAAWSIFEGQMGFFTVITLIAVAVVTYLLVRYRNENKLFTIGLALVLAGAIGNFIDRVRLGYVVDMFQTDFMNFPIFNVADMSLCIGVGLIFIYTIFDEKMKGK